MAEYDCNQNLMNPTTFRENKLVRYFPRRAQIKQEFPVKIEKPPPYVVLVGDVRVGKSTLVEKLCGVAGLGSNQSTSFTQVDSEHFVLDDPDGTIICDTPGTNPMGKRLEHNCHIASAMSRRPVGLLLIVVKADTGVSNVVDAVTKYAENFLDFDRIVGVCVTHMDTVEWEEGELRSVLEQACGIESVMFSRLTSTSSELLRGLNSVVRLEPMNISIDSSNFLRFFRINDRNLRVLRSVRNEVELFQNMRQSFYSKLPQFEPPQRVDLMFEFKAWLTLEMKEAQKRVAEFNEFTFCDDARLANEAGHIASLTNQLKKILYDVRIKALEYSAPHGIGQLRSCPHCGQIWTLVIGCDGETTCGEWVDRYDVREGRNGVMATYRFVWNRAEEELEIVRMNDRRARKIKHGDNQGCGRTIVWSEMAAVPLPPEWSVEQPVKMDDVRYLAPEQQSSWHKFFTSKMAKLSIG